MSIGYSSIELIGYLGRDPRPIQSGSHVRGASFSMAVNRVWTDEADQRQEKAAAGSRSSHLPHPIKVMHLHNGFSAPICDTKASAIARKTSSQLRLSD